MNDPFDEQQHRGHGPAADPETLLLQTDDTILITRAMHNLPHRFHHLVILREFEGLSYQELADAAAIPIGTVMSRLSRARVPVRGALHSEPKPLRQSALNSIDEEEADAVLV